MLLVVVAAVVVAAVVVDLVWTTVAVGGGRGPISDRVARMVSAAGRTGHASHRRMQVAGVAAAAAVPAAWVLLTWAGFAIMLVADTEAVVSSATQQPTSVLGRIAYAGGGLAGAGASLVAGTPGWELVNNIAAVIGLILVTLSLTYLFQVVNAVAGERTVSSQVDGLGPGPAQTVAAAPPDLGALPIQLTSIASGVSQAAQDHLALPMLQFFHSCERSSSVPLNVARFDEILTVIEYGLVAAHNPTVRAGRAAVDAFLGTLTLARADPGPPPVPSLAPLRAAGHEVVDEPVFRETVLAISDRRTHLRAFVEDEGWSWNDVGSPV